MISSYHFVSGITILIVGGWFCQPAIAQRGQDLQQQIESIRSVEQVKGQIRELLQSRDQCAVGSCYNFTGTAICEAIGALDIRVDGKIFSGGTGWTDKVLPISQTDLELMRQIFSQCKPSNYQYWNFGSILHLLYNPSKEADVEIRRQLGIPSVPERR